MAKVDPPGVVTGRYGTLGQVYYVTKPFWPLNTTLYVRDFKGADERFTAYFLTDMGLPRWEGAAAVPGLDRNVLHKIEVKWPPLPIQRKIAAILAAYDELIANNLRRIEILEEMAQAVYREWFVDFRFPGHEDVEMVESEFGPIPEGWRVANLFDIAHVAYGFGFKSPLFQNGPEGERVVRIRDIPKNTTSTFTSEESDERYRIMNDDVLIGMDGDFHMCVWADGPAMLNQRVTRVRPREDLPVLFLFEALRVPIRHFNETITGTTVAHLGDRHLRSVEIVIPGAQTLSHAAQIMHPTLNLIRNLRTQNTNLRTARDLLLPKLVSGEIDVSDLDINTEWLVA